ncbi:MAG: hypothetical protein ACXAC5_01730 [Promethearchaeota archaeon]|jgi:hypothetical protein
MSSKQIVSTSLANAASEGVISSQSQTAIESELDDIALAGCEGVDVEDIDSEEVTLVIVAIDGSGSMYEWATEVTKAYREQFLEPLRGAKNANSILVSVLVFSGGRGENIRLLHGYTPVPQCPELTDADYQPDGSTPLYDAVWNGLTGLVTYGQHLRDNGTRTKSIAVVLSDGWENASRISASKLRRLSGDVLKQQEFVLAYVFFGDQADGDKYAKDIGFPPHHRLTEDLDGSGIRRVFGQVSASVITTSQALVSAGAISTNPFFAPNP